MMSRSRGLLLVATVLLLSSLPIPSSAAISQAGLSPAYYSRRCPSAVRSVRSAVAAAQAKDPTVAGALLRLFFHDCFVAGGTTTTCGGCDASVLLNHTGSEQFFPGNLALRGYSLVNTVKRTLERACPRTVSCADILALAARFAVSVTGGPDINIPLGRRDSPETSFLQNAGRCLPSEFSPALGLSVNFRKVGLNRTDLISLSGAHTIGRGHCHFFQDRLFDATTGRRRLDPTLNRTYARTSLYRTCRTYKPPPINRAQALKGKARNMDPFTGVKFDNKYFQGLLLRQGMFVSDQTLFDTEATKSMVVGFANNQAAFFKAFSESFIRMGGINVLTAPAGVIRKVCFKN